MRRSGCGRRDIDYHLAHARSAAASASPSARASIATSAEGLVRALERLHAERDLSIEIDAPASHAFRGQREDLDEMLGNLLDNACKWACARVRLTSTKEGEQVVIVIDDDGPGIEPSMREAVLRRGVRADEAAPGSGLGLAIVRDLAEVYGGSISLGRRRWEASAGDCDCLDGNEASPQTAESKPARFPRESSL